MELVSSEAIEEYIEVDRFSVDPGMLPATTIVAPNSEILLAKHINKPAYIPFLAMGRIIFVNINRFDIPRLSAA